MTNTKLFYLKIQNSEVQALVDEDIWLRFCRCRWSLKRSAGCFYVCRSFRKRGKVTTQRLHRLVMDCPEGMDVHHINEDPLDNRRESLQVISPADHAKLHKSTKSDLPI